MYRTIWLWLLVIFVGIQFGAGWYEKLAIVPLWADASADQVLAAMESSGMKRAGRVFWPFVSPVVALLAVINLVLAWRSNISYRRWWLAAGAAMTVYALASYGYFVPQMLAFQSGGDGWTAPEIETFVTWWTGVNYLRMTIGGIGWLCALRALSLSGSGRSTLLGERLQSLVRASEGPEDNQECQREERVAHRDPRERKPARGVRFV